jgi:hypothetical protein
LVARRFTVWQKLVALAPLLLVAVHMPAEMMLRCRISGLLRPACCCPNADQPQDSGPVAKAQDCCDREITASERPVVEAARRADPDSVTPAASVATIAASTATDAFPARQPGWAAQRYGPARGRPSTVLVKHAFLI